VFGKDAFRFDTQRKVQTDMQDFEVLKDGEYTTFRGKPLVRDKNVLCYGDNEKDAYVLVLMILSYKTVNGVEVPDMMMCQVLSTDTSLDAVARVRKNYQANGLFQALDLGIDYLDRYNKK
jgi:hypothetical protein